MSIPSDTIAALATPAGTSAIAVVRVSGPAASALAEAIFSRGPTPREVRRGDYRTADGAELDDVLFTFFPGPKTYTGEDTLEISGHGNPYVVRRVLADLYARGCRPAEPGEFTRRAFLNGRMDLSQAEAVMDLIHARSERALAAANRQLRGALGRRMEELTSALVRIVAQVEAQIDFPEEDLPAEDRTALRDAIARLASDARRLHATSRYGALLRDGIGTVIVGEPNVGKSSLLNRLVGRERALVSAEAGTTRDYLEERIDVGAHWLRLIDTAGWQAAPSALERRGIELAFEQAREADLFLWVLDAMRPAREPPAEVAGLMNPTNTIVVVNKTDLLERSVEMGVPHPWPTVPVSALTGSGLEELRAAIGRMADSFQGEVGDELIAINSRHALALDQGLKALDAAGAKLEQSSAYELMASDLRQALDAFGQISGRVDNERILDELFSKFCIGK